MSVALLLTIVLGVLLVAAVIYVATLRYRYRDITHEIARQPPPSANPAGRTPTATREDTP